MSSGSVKVLDAAIARFMTTLGKFEAGPGVKILNQMTDGLDRMSNYMNAPPQDNLQPLNSVVRQPQQQPTQVTVNAPVYLDGEKIADNTQTYVMKEIQRTFDREMRASNAMPDPLSTPRVPGVPWGH
ncbi:hypothetical protein [Acetobacter sp. AAB5]|uniref:hypothetical protein n=1 Tax=Acetobacter sp. AAB5 TaxID=3418370 RepID=UPI003CF8E4EB